MLSSGQHHGQVGGVWRKFCEASPAGLLPSRSSGNFNAGSSASGGIRGGCVKRCGGTLLLSLISHLQSIGGWDFCLFVSYEPNAALNI
jgi:hypothetical protein